MPSLFDDFRSVATPLAPASRASIWNAIEGAQQSLLRGALKPEPEELPDSEVLSTLRRYALWLDNATDSDAFTESERESMLHIAVQVYELVGQLSPSDPSPTLNIFRPPLGDYLRSALLGARTAYSAESSSIADRLRTQLEALRPANDESEEALQMEAALALVCLLARDHRDAFVHASRSERLAVGLASSSQDPVTLRSIDSTLAVARAVARASIGLLTGTSAVIESADDLLGRLRDSARSVEDADRYWLALRLRQVISQMRARNVHFVLRSAGVPDSYIKSLIRDGVVELWSPQVSAAAAGIADPDGPGGFVVSIPTGAGKTMIAEIALASALRTNGWAVYVAPSRALVNQVSSDLQHRLGSAGVRVQTFLAGAEQSGLITDELELLSTERTVTVTTPERLDAYYRNDRNLFDSCKVAIFDEIHKISDETRGPVIESLVTRLSLGHEACRIVLLSGVMSNPEELAAWLHGATTIVESRRPTRQLRGVAVRHDLVPRAPRKPWKGIVRRRVDFKGGIVLARSAADLDAQEYDVHLPDLFEGHFQERQYRQDWREDRTSTTRTSVNDHAIALAERFSQLPGTTLVFVQTVLTAESSAKKCQATLDDEFAQEREALARYVESLLGDQYPLADLCRRGTGFHHARLPAAIQRALELAIQRGWLRVLFATPTLREGLNTAATNVILAGEKYWDAESKVPVSIEESDFENLAGRAGRPGREIEGRVFLVPESLASAMAVGRRYLLAGKEALLVTTQLGRLNAILEEMGNDIRELPPQWQSLLLGVKAAGFKSVDELTNFFGSTLWSVQDSEAPSANGIRRAVRAFEGSERALGGDLLDLAAKSGMSLSSIERMRDVLAQYLPTLVDTADVTLGAVVAPLLEASLSASEVRRGELDRFPDWQAHQQPLMHWIEGSSYHVLLDAAKAEGVLRPDAKVGEAVRYSTVLADWISWGFGSCAFILSSLTPSPHPLVANLPLLVKYGVPNQRAAYLSMLGVSDRSVAMQMSAAAKADDDLDASLESTRDWLEQLNEEALETILPGGGLERELVGRRTIAHGESSQPYLLARISVADFEPGQVLRLVPIPDGLAAVSTDGHRAEVQNERAILEFSAGAPESLSCMVLSSADAGSHLTAMIR